MAHLKDYSKSKRRGAVNPTNSLGASTRPRKASPSVQKSSASNKAPIPAPRRNPTRATTVHETDLSSDTDGIVVQMSLERQRLQPPPRDKDVFMSGALGPGDWSRKPRNAEEKHAMKAQRAIDEKARLEAEKRYRKERMARRKDQRAKLNEEKERLKEEKARAKEDERAEKKRVVEEKQKATQDNKAAKESNKAKNATDRSSRRDSKVGVGSTLPLLSDEDDSSINAPPIPIIPSSVAKPKVSPLGPATIKRRKRASSIFSPDRDNVTSKLGSAPSTPGNTSYLASSKFRANGIFDNANDSEIERDLARELELDESFLPEQVSASPYVAMNHNATTNGDQTAVRETEGDNVLQNSIKSTTPPFPRNNSLKRKLSPAPPSSPPALQAEQLAQHSLTSFLPADKAAFRSPSPAATPPKSSSPTPEPTNPTRSSSNPASKKQTHIPTTQELQSCLPKRRPQARNRLRSASKPTNTQQDDEADNDSDSSPLSSAPSSSSSESDEAYGETPVRRKANGNPQKKRVPASTTKAKGVGPRLAPQKVYGGSKEATTNGDKRNVTLGESDKENKALEVKDGEGEPAGSLDSGESVEGERLGGAAKEPRPELKGVKEKFEEVDEWTLDFEEVTNGGFESSPLDAR